MVNAYNYAVNRSTLLDAYPLPKVDQAAEKIASYAIYSTLDLKSAHHQIRIRDVDKTFTAFKAGRNLFQFLWIPFDVTKVFCAFTG